MFYGIMLGVKWFSLILWFTAKKISLRHIWDTAVYKVNTLIFGNGAVNGDC
jgi:hypothetical protein